MSVRTGILEKFYFGGVNLRNPDAYAYALPKCSDEIRLADGVLVEDQPYLYDGQPDELRRPWSCTATWSKLKDLDQDALLDLQGSAGWIDFADWRFVTEQFSSDGTRTTVRTLRRRALDVIDSGLLPSTASVRYAGFAKVNGVAKVAGVDFTIGTADADGRLLYTFGTALPAGTGVLKIKYVPIFYTRILSDGFNFATSKAFTEGYTLQLVEGP